MLQSSSRKGKRGKIGVLFPSASKLLDNLTEVQHRHLRAFAARRLGRLVFAAAWPRILARTSPDDLVHRAVEKVLDGERNPRQGRTLSARDRASTDAFVACLTGIINSELSHLICSAEARYGHVSAQTGEETSDDVVEVADPRNLRTTVELRDLKVALFRNLRAATVDRPKLWPIIDAWETVFLEDLRIPTTGFDRRLVSELRELARGIYTRLTRAARPKAPKGVEMLF